MANVWVFNHLNIKSENLILIMLNLNTKRELKDWRV